MKKIATVCIWVVGVAFFVLILASAQSAFPQENRVTVAPYVPTSPFAPKDMMPEDMGSISEIFHTVNELNKDVQNYQLQMELAQAHLARINEVQLPALVGGIRKKYNLDEEHWSFNLSSFTFTRKPDKP